MHTIYRVEHKGSKEGPFCGSYAPRGFVIPITSEHPNITTDVIKCRGEYFPFSYVCGCLSLDMLRHWFGDNEWITALSIAHYEIAVYEVPNDDVLFTHSNTQVAFYQTEAYRVSGISILTLLA